MRFQRLICSKLLDGKHTVTKIHRLQSKINCQLTHMSLCTRVAVRLQLTRCPHCLQILATPALPMLLYSFCDTYHGANFLLKSSRTLGIQATLQMAAVPARLLRRLRTLCKENYNIFLGFTFYVEVFFSVVDGACLVTVRSVAAILFVIP